MTRIEFKNSGTPKYQQLTAAIARDIVTGKIQDGEFLPSMLDLANYNEVSIDTVVRSYRQLKKMEVIGLNISRRHLVISPSRAFKLIDGSYF